MLKHALPKISTFILHKMPKISNCFCQIMPKFHFYTFYIPSGIISPIKTFTFAFDIPLYSLWHSHKSKSEPKGISHTSSCLNLTYFLA